MLSLSAPGHGWLALQSYAVETLCEHTDDIVACLAKFVRSWGRPMPCQTALLQSLSSYCPMEVARAVHGRPAAGLETCLDVECLWLLPMGAIGLAQRGERGPVIRMLQADPLRAVQQGVFTYTCLLDNCTADDVLPGARTLPVVDKHTMAYALATQPEMSITGPLLALFADLDGSWPAVMAALHQRGCGRTIDATRCWLRRRAWLLVVSRAARKAANPACLPCAPGVRRLSGDLVRAVASWL